MFFSTSVGAQIIISGKKIQKENNAVVVVYNDSDLQRTCEFTEKSNKNLHYF